MKVALLKSGFPTKRIVLFSLIVTHGSPTVSSTKKNETFVGRWADSSAGSFQGNDVQNEPVPTSFRLFVKCHQEIASVHVGQFLKINCEFMGAVTLDATTIRHVFNTTDGSGGNSFCVLTVLSRQYIAMAVPVRKFFKKYQFYSTEFWGKILFVSKIRLQ